MINFFACILLSQIYAEETIEAKREAKIKLVIDFIPDLIDPEKRKSNFRQLSLQLHPDKNLDDKEFATNLFTIFNNLDEECEDKSCNKEKSYKEIWELRGEYALKKTEGLYEEIKYPSRTDSYKPQQDAHGKGSSFNNSGYHTNYTDQKNTPPPLTPEKIENNSINLFRSYLLAIDSLVTRNNFTSEIMHKNNSTIEGRFDCGLAMFRFSDINPISQFSNVIPFIGYNKKDKIQNTNSYYEASISAMLLSNFLSLDSNKTTPGYKETAIGVLHSNITFKNTATLKKSVGLSFQTKMLYNINTKQLFDLGFLTSLEVELLPFASVLLGYNIRRPNNDNYAKLGLRLYNYYGSLLLYAQSSNFDDFNNTKFLKEIKKQNNSFAAANKPEEKDNPIIFSSLIGIEVKLYLDDINLLIFGAIGSTRDVVNLNSSDLTIIKSFGYNLGCTLELADKDSAFFSVSIGLGSDSSLAKGKIKTLIDNYQFQDSSNYMNSAFVSLNLNLNF